MISIIRAAPTALLFLLVSSNTFAQSAPTSLFACLDGNGNLYGVTPSGKLGEGCSTGDLPVSLGSAGEVKAGNGLVGNLSNGVVDIGVAEGLAIPPACPPGQIPISDGNSAWICTLPNLTANSNPGAKIWVVPEFGSSLWSGEYWFVELLNLGIDTAHVSCHFFTRNGTFARDYTQERTIPSGGLSRCQSIRAPAVGVAMWVAIVSDVPILPSANRQHFGRTANQVESYPINCLYPEGYEFVCDYAID